MYVAAVFLILLLYASYDIGSRTTFPGRKGHLRKDLENRFKAGENHPDSVRHPVSGDSALHEF